MQLYLGERWGFDICPNDRNDSDFNALKDADLEIRLSYERTGND